MANKETDDSLDFISLYSDSPIGSQASVPSLALEPSGVARNPCTENLLELQQSDYGSFFSAALLMLR